MHIIENIEYKNKIFTSPSKHSLLDGSRYCLSNILGELATDLGELRDRRTNWSRKIKSQTGELVGNLVGLRTARDM